MREGGQRHGGDGGISADDAERYRPAAAYVELDRAHRKRSSWSAVFAFALVVLAASLVMLGVIGFSYLQGQQKYQRIAQSADLGGDDRELAVMTVDWEALRAINSDTVAWLFIPGTSVNYPVVRGADNEYYLTHDFDGDAGWLANYGAVFMDWRNDPDWSDDAYFLYGHHMNDGSMFADVARMTDQARFDASRTVYVLSPDGSFRLRTFSLVHCAADDPLVQTAFSTPQEMTAYVQDKIDRSVVKAGGIPAAADITKVFALATCDNLSAGRYVLYACVEEETRLGFPEPDGEAVGLLGGGEAETMGG